MHIGNWLGAIRNYVALQDGNECLYCVVDEHAITRSYEPAELSSRTREMAISLLAAGVDPSRATLFVQSHVGEHATLAWLLTTIAHIGELERMTQYKEKAGSAGPVAAGLLSYPVLMAADILLYRAGAVPVGHDQLQHLELARDLARRWNHEFADGDPLLIEPEPIMSEAARIMGLDGKAKMSKSLGNTIGVMESREEIWQKLRGAVTDPARVTRADPGTPEVCNVYDWHRWFSPPDVVREVAHNCRTAAWGCIDCKQVLLEHMATTLAPIRERGLELRSRPEEVDAILGDGAAVARRLARETLAEVKDRMGFLPEAQ